MNIKKELFGLRDIKYRDFNARLIPSVDKNRIIGVKTPELRAIAKRLAASDSCEDFLRSLPHEYFEENQIHAFIISEIPDFEHAVTELERFLPYVDNWATCDQMSLRAFRKAPERVLSHIDSWLESGRTYTVRFGICTLMKYFLDERFDIRYLDKVACIKTDEYYINMCSAWFFATALAKQYEAALLYISEHRLTKWVHNKAITKACESFRVSSEHKNTLKYMKL